MKRRQFLTTTGSAALAAQLPISLSVHPEPSAKFNENDFLEQFIEHHDLSIDSILEQQSSDRTNRNVGGFPTELGIFHVGRAASFISRMAAGFVLEKSRHFQSDRIERALDGAIDFVNKNQHEDGTIDLITTNFHSTPDTGFVVEPISIALGLVRKLCKDRLDHFQTSAESFLRRAGMALAVGGIHTPNHRWVVCMAMARIHQLIPDAILVNRIGSWLNEQIDIDSEGHYNERSTSVYSPLTNRCLITMARLLNRPGLLAPVRKNLNLAQYLVRANGEIVTEVSRRQDQFRIAKMGNYYHSYRYMAIRDSNPAFAAMAKMIEATVGLERLAGNLPYFMDDPSLQNALPSPGKLPTQFVREFSESKIVRIRRGNFDATILADNETFATIHKGESAIRAVRFATAFFGKGQFKSDSIQKTNDGFVLSQSLSGPYYQPLSPALLPGSGDWAKMPKDKRPQSEIQRLNYKITIRELEQGLSIFFDVTGTNGVPVAIEMAVDDASKFNGMTAIPSTPNAFLMNEKESSICNGTDLITIQGAKSKHQWTQLRGALPKLDARCIYIADFTPFRLELKFSGGTTR